MDQHTNPASSCQPVADSGFVLCIGFDLGDRFTQVCLLDRKGQTRNRRLRTRPEALMKFLSSQPRSRVVFETCGVSSWVRRLVVAAGHEAVMANARELHLISQSYRKNDRRDAELLARLGLADPKLLRPVVPRSAKAQRTRALMNVRRNLVEQRTRGILSVRGLLKSFAIFLGSCSSEGFPQLVHESLTGETATAESKELSKIVLHQVSIIEALTEEIRIIDRKVKKAIEVDYPEVNRLMQVQGVGPITALSVVLAIDDPTRFTRGRHVASYFGLCPRQDQSGDTDKQLRISKAGDRYVRQLLVQCAHYILARGKDSHLKRWGLALAQRGGANAKKRAAVAVARKLAVLLHSLWLSGEDYEPMRGLEVIVEEVEATVA